MTQRAMTGRAYAVVTGGGTSGHVLPALAVADALVAAGHDAADIRYVGARRGVETRLLPATPYPHEFLDVVGVQRRFTRANLGFAPKMLRSTREATRLLRRWRPQVVVSVGGYASMPSVFAARRLRIPVVVVSYDRTPGRASRLAARFAAACAVAFENSPLPRAVVTGAPVRQAILDVDRSSDASRAAAREALGLEPERFVIAVMGGSLGSGVLNESIANYLAGHSDDGRLAVRQITGERFVDAVVHVEGEVLHQVVGYEADMAAVYTACDLMIGRGGASTVHEVAVTGTPAILVPWAASADDHQTDNVQWLSEVGGAILLPESQLTRLGETIDALRGDRERRVQLSDSAGQRGAIHRSGALAGLIERIALTSTPS
ncbi:MAG TPA: UDP-N-acetylglucosamine--N-acetylmuramyl-(pentapeptide) pyrophosphoryl-undecaprenol N-acetylglucosamine transferase [Ilumatobacteraceae bacterium]|nr:UDP-N-acetylglucosamine--N-acetylmuramyl-(pentapeptide) pyrophosphoryl-undecaprenol N-acetylglucosamine transferase [Ilumatobacteraceae bacterium]